MINALIVDDEPQARRNLRRALEGAKDIHILGECGNAFEALTAIHKDKPDVVFLDIQMPQVTGIQMLSMLDHTKMPYIVFLTAYDEYAVEAFEKNAFDYLLKPVTNDRLELTLQRLRSGLVSQNLGALPEANHLRQVPCFGQNTIFFLKIEEIEFIESRMAGIFVTDIKGNERPTALPLSILQNRTSLLRCHRQFLINMDKVQKLNYVESGVAKFVTTGGRTVPISRRLLPSVKEWLGIK